MQNILFNNMISGNKLIIYLIYGYILIVLVIFNISYYQKSIEFHRYEDSKYNIRFANTLQDSLLTKKVWQTAPSNVGDKTKGYMSSWESIPDWEYKNEKDDDVFGYLIKRFPDLDMSRIIKEKKILAFDLWRYAKVYDEGGLYADSDVSKSNEFESAISKLSGCKVILGIEADSRTKGDWWVGIMQRQLQINQWSFYSAPNHPILKFVIDRIIKRLQYRLDREDELRTDEVEDLTGPAVWTDTLKDYLRLVVGVDIEKEMKCGQSYKYDDICLLNIMAMAGNTARSHSCPNNPESDNFFLSTHHFEGSWKD